MFKSIFSHKSANESESSKTRDGREKSSIKSSFYRLGDLRGAMFRGGFDSGLVGLMVLGEGEKIKIKESRWSNSYQANDDENFTLSKASVDVNDGVVTFKSPHDLKGFQALYEQWKIGSLKLYRGISSSHFSWDEIVFGERVVSEGSGELPRATMGARDEEKTCWLPTAPSDSLDMVTGIAMGNHTDTIRHTMTLEDNVLLGGVIEFDIGNNRDIPINFLYNGEVLVKGPVEAGKFSMAKLVISTAEGKGYEVIDYGSASSKYADELPNAAPYPIAGSKPSPEKLALEEYAGVWKDKNKQKIERLRNKNHGL